MTDKYSEIEEIKLQFGPHIVIFLPKNDVAGSWNKLKKYMELYLQFEQEDAVRNATTK